MKSLKFLTLVFFCNIIILNSNAQNFSSLNVGKNAGVNGLFTNPASIANSNYKWDVNLIGASGSVAFGYNDGLDSVTKRGIKGDKVASYLQNNIKINGLLNVDVYGPSAMLSINNKSSIAISNRYRVLASAKDVGGLFTQNKSDSLVSLKGLPIQKANFNEWKEIGITYATTIARNEKQIITAGITTKYITGASNNYFRASNLSGTAFIGEKEYISNASGRLEIGNSVDENEKSKGRGFGTDIGFVYEKLNTSNDKQVASTPYKYRLGISILDIGFVNYIADNKTFADYTIHIPAGEKFETKVLDDKTLLEAKAYLDAKPAYFTNNNPKQKKYTVSLPTTAVINFDYAVTNKLFVDLSTQISMIDKDNLYSTYIPNSISIVTRYENKLGAVFLPVSYNELSKFNVGIGAKIGAFYFGSNSIFTSVIGKFKQVDFQAGVRFGIKTNGICNKIKSLGTKE
jgi:hypothetical protein